MQDSNNLDFHLLLALAIGFEKIEQQSGYSIIQKDNNYCIFEPNATIPFAKIPIDTIIKEFQNECRETSRNAKADTTIKQEGYTLQSRVGKCADNVLERVRGMVQERNERSKEASRRSRSESEERTSQSEERRGISRQDRGLSQTSNAFGYLFREQILAQESINVEGLSADKQAIIDLHNQYKDYKRQVTKARAIKTYLELGGISNDKVANIANTANATKDNPTEQTKQTKDTSQDLQESQDLQHHKNTSNKQNPYKPKPHRR